MLTSEILLLPDDDVVFLFAEFAKFVFKEPVHAEQMLIFWVFAYLLNEDGLKPFHLALEELEHLSTLVLGLLHQGTVI